MLSALRLLIAYGHLDTNSALNGYRAHEERVQC